ncbi:hypothetical protein AVEN_20163-1 [Araneus ventricosus]|uniref:Uncharacterized protein n=1 Tax=Araneus ventricosus TaxID=182803 RepID=A0A4Y2QDE4_ARAVE|nr:hypothetical protein AVEN_185374-1 [Araneus ventricosus]GBN61484.1 hypothetical protein AVEN_185098-1 [Araneus ventricosus]GBN62822.1 hypothetical protein AVEN_140427-1 [Araneus ventricosus]GBN62867.1 hypothetical protein AVEN_20163-1 [Araneus ventricosus]
MPGSMTKVHGRIPCLESNDDAVTESCPMDLECSFPNELRIYLLFGSRQQQQKKPLFAIDSDKIFILFGNSVPSEKLVTSLNDIVSDEKCQLADQHIASRDFMNRLYDNDKY